MTWIVNVTYRSMKLSVSQESDDMPTGSQITRDVTSRLQQILKETSGNVMFCEEKSASKKPVSRTPKENVRPNSKAVIGAYNMLLGG